MGTGELLERPNKNAGGGRGEGSVMDLASHPGGVAILLIISCYRN